MSQDERIAVEREKPPYAHTDQHAAALERAIRAEGYEILIDPNTGEFKLERLSQPSI